MKYSEAEKQIKALSSKYNFNMSDGDFIVNYKNMLVAWVKNNKRYLLYNNENCFKKIPFSNKLYMILAELAMTPIDERSTKQRVKIKGLSLSTGDSLYLNFDPIKGNYFVSHLNRFFKNKFTDYEIDELVNDPDFFLQAGSYETEEDE